ncbi:MAG: heavy metal translocating P-type ATPase, partial [Firmicutes bacterium]|nr:heavy metal translocating P-type ATPase [Bacillota bacterium]
MRYRLAGLDCASCAVKIEQELRKIEGLEKVTVSFATETVDLPPELVPFAEEAIARVEPEVQLLVSNKDTSIDEEEEGNGTRHLYVIGLAGLLLTVGTIFNASLHLTPYSWAEYLILLASYFLVGWPVIRKAVQNLVRGQVFDENFLMTVATAGAIAIHQLPEAAAVMLFYSVGEYFQDRAVDRSRRSIGALLDIRP